MAKYSNRKRLKGPTFERGDAVYLLRKNIKTKRPSDKLDYKKIGPFQISEVISPVNYKLDLPDGMRIHPVFHVSLLEPAPHGIPLETNIEVETYKEEYEVETIGNYQRSQNNDEYLVKWKNYGPEENTWEPKQHLMNCQKMIAQYHQHHPEQGNPNRTKQGRQRTQ